jgi:hypothetical protein
MPTFKDVTGKEWSIKFDGLLLADLKQEHGINLADVSGGDYLNLELDSSALTVAVCHLVRGQLGATSREQFAGNLVGESLEQAMEAVWGAAKVFFPPKKLSALQSNYSKLKAQWEPLSEALALVNLTGMPQEVKDSLGDAIKMGAATLSRQSAVSPSASGPAANPSNAATASPA